MFCNWIISCNSVLWWYSSDQKLHTKRPSSLILRVFQGSCRSQRRLYWWTAPADSDGSRNRGIGFTEDMWGAVHPSHPFILCLYTCRDKSPLRRVKACLQWKTPTRFPMHLFCIISQHVGRDKSCETVESLTVFPAQLYKVDLLSNFICLQTNTCF